MAKEDQKKKAEIQRPAVGEDILSLLESVRIIEKSSAYRELKVTPEIFDSWVDELEKGGWIKVTDRELDDYYIELTTKSKDMIEQLKQEKKDEESAGIEEPVIQKESKPRKSIKISPKAAVSSTMSLIRSNIMDLSVIAAFLMTIYLISSFISDPNQRALNFLAAVVLFSAILLVYRSSKEKLKTKTLVESISEFLTIMVTRVKLVIFSLLLVLFVYFVGWAILFPEYFAISAVMCTVVLSSVIQLTHPFSPRSRIPKFYAGMVLIVYSLLLLIGMTTISDLLFQVQSRIIDISAGIAILAVAYIWRGFFGVNTTLFKQILSQERGL